MHPYFRGVWAYIYFGYHVSAGGWRLYEEELFDEPFLRIHQYFIVNVNKVGRYLKADNGYVIMSTGKSIKVSRSKKDELMDFFKMRRMQNKKWTCMMSSK